MQLWPCCGWTGGGLRPVSSTAPSLAMGVPRAEPAPVLGQPHLPWHRIAPTMGKAVPKAPFQTLVYRWKPKGSTARVGEAQFQMSSVCPGLPQTEVPQFAQFSSPSTNSSNLCSPTPLFSSWSTLQTPFL